MLTPQEVSEHAFAKAGFGGYNMAMVDEFLDQLTEDYTTLYKENAVLKSKMKVLVDKVEEYRSTEDAMRKTLLTAQKMADDLVKEGESQKAAMVAQAEEEARKKVYGMRQELEAEQLRLTAAQNATAAYVAKLKELCQHEVDYINSLGQLQPAPAPVVHDPVRTAAEDIQMTMNRIVEQQQQLDLEDTKDLETEKISVKVTEEKPGGLYSDLTAILAEQERRSVDLVPEEPVEEPTKRLTIDLEHLQFGKDYEIK